MGFFDDLKSNPIAAISGGLGTIAAGIPGAIVGGGIGSVFDKKPDQTPAPPAQDPNIAALQQQRVKEASDFKQNLPGLTNDLGQNLENQSRRALASDMATNNMSANRRGLLGSGINQAANARSSGQEAVGLAQGKQQLSDQLQNQADQMEASAINNGYQYWQSAKGIQDSAYNAALNNMMSARSGVTGLIGAGSKIGGAALGAA